MAVAMKQKDLRSDSWNHRGVTPGEDVNQKHLPDLVITDVVMPRMNGYELCRWIKSDPRSQAIPVMICSIKGEDFDRYWGMKQGADAYMTKPCPPSEMLSAVNHLLNSNGD